MSSVAASPPVLQFHPLTSERWRDLEVLFGERGATGGCWCMWWRLTGPQYHAQRGEGNRAAFKRIVSTGEVPGLLAYAESRPIGWCSVAPRERLVRLERSRILKRVDDQPVWSIGCFFVAKPFRRKGVTVQLLRAVVEYAKAQGAKIVEGYPVESQKGKMPDVFVWTGTVSAFRRAGFVEVVRRSKSQPIMRYTIGESLS